MIVDFDGAVNDLLISTICQEATDKGSRANQL
jgi:hypothetical protein